ncbi:unnamed protein product [Adineta steineri]|uniref:Uncharacterized protein n=1 Tax=Adineta steineri TaxID=433720 RepID=A0A819MMK0_9BILA|nr:unnamed protein product [Adineta steineri]CAF3982348.1 unnamed protein product [Adineta steineri]
MSSNSSSYQQYGNPVLYTFVGFTLQPYWLIIAEMLFLQALQRINSLIGTACKKQKKHVYIALEITILGPKRTGVAPLKYSVLDFFLSLVSVGHFVYSCYLQTKCSSAANANSWNCYNAFGYRLYNYVLPSVVSILVDSIVQLVNTYRAHHEDKKKGIIKGNIKYIKWFLLGTSITLNSLIAMVFIPFFVSNVIPMLIIYSWILVVILVGLILLYAIVITSVVNAIRKCEGCGCIYCTKFFAAHCVVGLQVFGCLVFSMAFNYSQYSFYGGDFNSVPWYEYQSRDTVTWFHSLSNSSELLTHNLLAAF